MRGIQATTPRVVRNPSKKAKAWYWLQTLNFLSFWTHFYVVILGL